MSIFELECRCDTVFAVFTLVALDATKVCPCSTFIIRYEEVTVFNLEFRCDTILTVSTIGASGTIITVRTCYVTKVCPCCTTIVRYHEVSIFNLQFRCDTIFTVFTIGTIRTVGSIVTCDVTKIIPCCAFIVRYPNVSIFEFECRCDTIFTVFAVLTVFTISTLSLNACVDTVDPPVTVLNVRNLSLFHNTKYLVTVCVCTCDYCKAFNKPFRNINCELATGDFKRCKSTLVNEYVTNDIATADITCTANFSVVAFIVVIPVVDANCCIFFSCTFIYDCSACYIKNTVNTDCYACMAGDCSLTLNCESLVNTNEYKRIICYLVIVSRSNAMTVKIKCNCTSNFTVICCLKVEIFRNLNVSTKCDCIAVCCSIKCFCKSCESKITDYCNCRNHCNVITVFCFATRTCVNCVTFCINCRSYCFTCCKFVEVNCFTVYYNITCRRCVNDVLHFAVNVCTVVNCYCCVNCMDTILILVFCINVRNVKCTVFDCCIEVCSDQAV